MRFGEFWRRLRFWRRRSALGQELAAELEEHLVLLTRDYELAGLPYDEARAAARRQLGNLSQIREESRDSWGFRTTESVLQDLRYAVRALRKRPGFALTAILNFALGIGLTSTLFGIVDGVVLHPLPYRDPGRLVALCERYPHSDGSWCSISPPNVEDIAAGSRVFEGVGIARSESFKLDVANGLHSVRGALVTPGFFRALGVAPSAGRLFENADVGPGAEPVALVSEQMWRSRFDGANDIVGRRIVLDGKSTTVVGVLPSGLEMPQLDDREVWTPLPFDPHAEENRAWPGFVAYARLRPGISLNTARGELAMVGTRLRAAHFATVEGWGLTLQPLQNLAVGEAGPTLLLFFGAVLLVLVIACANVANLLLARGMAQRQEIAVRSALGASRRRVVLGLLSETLLLALAGGGFAMLLATCGIAAFRKLAPAGIPRLELVHVDARVMTFTMLLVVATALIAGLMPALRLSGLQLEQLMRESGRAVAGHAGRAGGVLVILELALASVLVVGAGLVAKPFMQMLAWRPGFEQEHLLTFSMSAAIERYATTQSVGALWARTIGELRTVPSVIAVGASSSGPLFGGREPGEIRIEGAPNAERSTVRWYDVSPGYFAVVGVPVVRGREIGDADLPGAPLTAAINQTMAKQFWPGEDAVGRRFTMSDPDRTFTVIGVVRDVPPMRPSERVEPEVYWSNQQFPRWATFFVVRTETPPASVVGAIRARIQSIDPDLTLYDVSTLPERAARARQRSRFAVFVIGSFSLLALGLGAMGTYGLLAYIVAERTRELGIRMAFGARPAALVALVIKRGLGLAGAGIAIGLLMSLATGKVIAHFVGGVAAADPLTMIGTAAALGVVALAACAVPAVRASRVDPMVALRGE